MDPDEPDNNLDNSNSTDSASASAVDTATAMSTAAPFQCVQQLPMELQLQQPNPGLVNSAGMPYYASMPLTTMQGFSTNVPAQMQAPMYYPMQPLHQQPQMANSLRYSLMQPPTGMPAYGMMPAAMMPYGSNLNFQQQPIQPVFSLNSNAALFHQQMMQQNHGMGHYASLVGAATAAQATEDTTAKVSDETHASNGSQRVSASPPIVADAVASSSASANGLPSPKIDDKPKRPLSAYNLFFKAERAKMIADHSSTEDLSDSSSGAGGRRRQPHRKVGFEQMAKAIGPKWKSLDPSVKAQYQLLADEEKKRYQAEMAEYTKRQREEMEKCRMQLQATVSDEKMQQYLASSGASKPTNRKRKDAEGGRDS